MFDFLRRKSPALLRLERINAYIDGELTPAERSTFEREMEQDAALQAEVDALRELDTLLSELPQADVPRNFTLSAPRSTPTRLPRQLTPALAGLAMIVLVCGFIFNLLQEGFLGAPEVVVVTQIVERVTEVEVPGEVIVEEVVVTSVVEVETVVEEVVVTQVVEVASGSAIRFPTSSNLWRAYSDVTTEFAAELANQDTVPRLYRAQEPYLLRFQSDVSVVDGGATIAVDLVTAFWENGEVIDSADLVFTYQTCRDLELFAIDNPANGWATACSPDLLIDVLALAKFSAQFTFSTPPSAGQFQATIGQTPIMAEHIWSTIVTEALAFDDVAEGREFLLSTTP